MKRKDYKGQFDTFETPAGMWGDIEKGLDEKKKKKRGIVWWQVAAGIIIVAGIGTLMVLMGNDPSNNDTTLAHNGVDQKRNAKPGTETDTTNQLGAKTGYDRNGSDSLDGTVDIEYTVERSAHFQSSETVDITYVPEEKPSDQIELSATYGSGTKIPGGIPPVRKIVTNDALFNNPISLNIVAKIGTKEKLKYRNVTEEENISRLNYRREEYLGFIDAAGTVYDPTTGNDTKLKIGEYNKKAAFDFQDQEKLNYVEPSGPIVNGLIQENIPTKRLIPYEPLRESNSLWISGLETTNRSHYDAFIENGFMQTDENPLSTFSIDVDGASYSDVRGMINRNVLPNPDAVRIEEFVNYFPYDYKEPSGEHPFSIQSEIGSCPWNSQHQLMKVAIKGQSIEKENLPTNNLVFLLDVSGSMTGPDKLEIIKKAFRMLVNELREEDHVSICVYAGSSGVVLEPTSGANKDEILDAILRLSAGGSTAGGAGIELAYSLAEKHYNKDGNNRIILATDGDFNVGISDDDQLVKLIQEKRETGVFLTVLGVGHDNFQSSKMEKMANNGNGNFSYIDNILEAKKVFVTEMGATLLTIAKDVKIQMEFNPSLVSGYRLIGYENRMLKNQDFSNDTIDAGELGAGHTVTAIYEIIPYGVTDSTEASLKYSTVNYESNGEFSNEFAMMKFRYKEPDGTVSKLIEAPILMTDQSELPSKDFLFTKAVIEFGLILRQSEYMGSASFESVISNAINGLKDDPYGYRREFLLLVEKTELMWKEIY